MTAHLTSIQKPKKLLFTYKGEESEVYLDTVASDIGFWSQFRWDSNGFRKDKIYVVFDDSNVDWNMVKVVEKDAPKAITKKEKCEEFRKISRRNFEKFCAY